MNATIEAILLYTSGSSVAKISCEDGTKLDIEIPAEILTDKPMTERFNLLMEKANRYITCLAGDVLSVSPIDLSPTQPIVKQNKI